MPLDFSKTITRGMDILRSYDFLHPITHKTSQAHGQTRTQCSSAKNVKHTFV